LLTIFAPTLFDLERTRFKMWFLARSKSPEEIILTVTSAAQQLTSSMRAIDQALETGANVVVSRANANAASTTVDKHLQELKLILIGDAEKEHDESRGARVATAASVQPDFAVALVSCLYLLPLETRKSAAHVFANLARRSDGAAFAAIVASESTILSSLTDAYKDDKADLALISGMMLRETARHEIVAKALLEAPYFWHFFTDFVRLKNFEVASDAFELLKALLVGHCALAAGFIETNYTKFVLHYNQLLQSENYITCRESLRLLGELLLERANFSTMMKYISDPENLKILMRLLRNKKTRIQVEAFHVFKVFVANPRKPDAVTLILFNNKDKLVAFLCNFHNEREDEQFAEEKALVVDTLVGLAKPTTQYCAHTLACADT